MTRHLAKPLVVGVFWCVAAGLAGAQMPVKQDASSTTLSGQVDLARLVDTSAAKLNLRIVYDEQFAKGAKVTLRQPAPVGDAELWGLTNQLLGEQGYTTIAMGGGADGGRAGAGVVGASNTTLSVVKFAEAQQRARVETLEEVTIATPGVQPGYRRVLVRLERASGKDIVAAAQLMMSKPAGVVNEFGKDNLILLGDIEPHLSITLKLIKDLDSAAGGSVVREVETKNVEPGRLVTMVKQLADKQKAAGVHELRGEVVAGGGTRVLVIAPPSAAAAWEKLIAQVDQIEPVEKRTYSVAAFGLKEVASLIDQSIKPTRGASSVLGGGGGDESRWRVFSDELTGSLIITASPAEHDQIVQLMDRLSTIPAEARRPVRTFKIKNRGVKEMRQALIELLNAGVFDGGGGGVGGGDPTSPSGGSVGGLTTSASTQTSLRPAQSPPGAMTTQGSPDGPASVPPLSGERSVRDFPLGAPRAAASNTRASQLTLTADEPTNTLVAVGDPRVLAQIEQLLPTLDVRQPQVMLDAYIVSLNDSQSVDFGVELERLRVSGDTIIRLSSLFGLAGGSAGARTVPDRTGFTGAVLDPGDFSIVVRALEGISKGRSLSNPKVLVSNNEQATFNSVLQQPFASTNSNSTVATTSFGGTQDAGTTISVKPQVAQGDHVVLNYSVSLSSFTGAASNPNLPPPRQQNSVQSNVTIPDGYTVVVGGLEVETDGTSKTQVPIVGSIPLVGELFKNTSISKSKTRFFVFLRASVMRNSNLDDLKYVSEPELSRAKVDDGVPEVVPQVIR